MVASLFTKEFYELTASRLNEYGVFCQWLPNDVLKHGEIEMMIKTFGSVFEHVYVWKVQDSDIIMIGSMEPFKFSPRETSMRVSMLDTSETPMTFGLLLEPSEVAALRHDENVPINTDNHPVLEFKVVNNMLTACSLCGKDH
jgi:hypothetical protein